MVKRFLKNETPDLPLPINIDDDKVSLPSSASWPVVSDATAKAASTDQKPTLTVGCQTLPQGQVNSRGPRTNVKRLCPYDADTPLQPPKFGLKSKPPSLHYSGLQPPTLHCLATSLPEAEAFDTQISITIMRSTSKSLPCPSSFRKGVTKLQSPSEHDDSEAERGI